MLVLMEKKVYCPYKVRATDQKGNSQTFDTIKDTALYFDVTPQAIHNAIRLKSCCRGCIIEKIYEEV